MKNIFAVGSQVKGESQIGYERHIQKLSNLLATTSNNISITGLPRFGKTSLAKTVMNNLAQNENARILSIFLDLARYNSFAEVLEAIWLTLDEVLNRPVHGHLLASMIYKRVSQQIETAINNDKLNQLRMHLEKLIGWICGQNLKIIIVFDEFDAASKIFTSISDFEYFRDLCTNSDLDVSLLLVSRRPVYMIEKKNLIQSTFHGILQSYPISGFDADDMDKYYSTLEERYNICLNEDEKNVLLHYCGKSPYLMSMIGHELVAMLEAGEMTDIEKAYRNNEIDFRNYFKSIVTVLNSDAADDMVPGNNGMSTLQKLMGLIIGPKAGLTEGDIHFMEGMGYLFVYGEAYCAISPAFTNYLRELPIVGTPWDAVIGLQKKIVAMIRKQVMEHKNLDYVLYDVWREIFEDAGVGDTLDTYDEFIKSTMQNYAESVDLLDVCSLGVACKILAIYWDQWFSVFFNNDSWDKWKYKFELCAKARDPMAHGHEEYLSIEEKTAVECYCKEIIKILANSNACLDKEVELTLNRSKACKQAYLAYFRYARENIYAKFSAGLREKIIVFNAAHQTKERLEGFFEYNGAIYQAKIKQKDWQDWIPDVPMSEHLGKQFQLRITNVDVRNNTAKYELVLS